jgi:hypothetical protein
VGPEQEAMICVEVALGGASGAIGALRGFLPRSFGQRGPGGVRRPVGVGLALGNRRRRALRANPGLWGIPALRNPPRWDRSIDVYPRGAGSDGVVGTVGLVEGASNRQSHPFAHSDGGILRSHQAGADGPRPRR